MDCGASLCTVNLSLWTADVPFLVTFQRFLISSPWTPRLPRTTDSKTLSETQQFHPFVCPAGFHNTEYFLTQWSQPFLKHFSNIWKLFYICIYIYTYVYQKINPYHIHLKHMYWYIPKGKIIFSVQRNTLQNILYVKMTVSTPVSNKQNSYRFEPNRIIRAFGWKCCRIPSGFMEQLVFLSI